MGLLDDAIREHLDLKRRRGADPTEIERAEREALGPVRREASATALSEAEPPLSSVPAPSEEFDFELASDTMAAEVAPPVSPISIESDQAPAGIAQPTFADPPAEDFTDPEDTALALPPTADFDLPSARPIEAREPRHKRRHLFGRHRHDHDHDFEPVPGESALPAELPEDAPFREAAPPVLRITPEAELGHTMEYDVEQAFADEDEADEDILEETPDFLADTPDHDRLWFEQKPPPDFDFDN